MFDDNTKEIICDGCGSKDNLQRFTSVEVMLSGDHEIYWDYCPNCILKYQIDWPEDLSDFEAYHVKVDN